MFDAQLCLPLFEPHVHAGLLDFWSPTAEMATMFKLFNIWNGTGAGELLDLWEA